MNPVVHFEMPYEDKERAKAFYESVFGWRTQDQGPEMGEYVLVTTTEPGPDHRPKMPGAINGGLYKRTEPRPSTVQYPSVVIAVQDLAASVEKVRAHGGTVLRELEEIPGVGKLASVTDTEGNRMSLLQPDPMM